jgi:hypothetical protein
LHGATVFVKLSYSPQKDRLNADEEGQDKSQEQGLWNLSKTV